MQTWSRGSEAIKLTLSVDAPLCHELLTAEIFRRELKSALYSKHAGIIENFYFANSTWFKDLN